MSPTGFVPFRLTVCGLDELGLHCEARVSHVLSILDPGWPFPADLARYGEHARLDLRFDDIIEDDAPGRTPLPADVAAILVFGSGLAAGHHLLVHCHAGVSRSTAAMALILAQARPDRPAAEALAEVVRIRPQAWPNLRLVEIGDRLLGRGGALVDAARARYREVVARRPATAASMLEAGRGREVRGL